MKNKNNWVKPPFLSEIYSHVSQQSKDTGDVINDDPREAGFAQGARGFNPVALSPGLVWMQFPVQSPGLTAFP